MADAPPKSGDQPVKANSSADSEETNWGEDWESAFQAEDDTFFSDGQEDAFFLEEKEPTVAGGAAAQDVEPSLKKTLSTIPDQQTAQPGVSPAQFIAGILATFTAVFLSSKAAAQKQFARLQSFPIFVRIPIYALPLLLAVTIFALSGTDAPQPSLQQTATSSTQLSGGDQAVSPDRDGDGAGAPEASRLHPGKVRKKWAFPAFIIPVNNSAPEQPVTFVLVDITLIAYLEEQEEPPAEKKIFVRDIIYQFFQNRSLEELRRFTLARGDMNRELRAWMQKQWPEAPIESIIFNQYHVS